MGEAGRYAGCLSGCLDSILACAVHVLVANLSIPVKAALAIHRMEKRSLNRAMTYPSFSVSSALGLDFLSYTAKAIR